MEIREGNEYEVVYYLGQSEVDDSFEDNSSVRVYIEAPSIDLAVRYAEQYMRKMQTEEDTADKWANAEIQSVILR